MSRDVALQIMKRVNKKMEDNAIQILGDPSSPLIVNDVLSTGLPNLDRIISCSVSDKWGLPVGRIINVKAKPSVGKTSFVLKVAKEAQKRGGMVWIVESEHALDLNYAKKLGCDVDNYLISQPDTLDQALEITEIAVNACSEFREEGDTAPFLIILDSFSGFTTEGEMTGSGGLGEHARLASKFCRKMTASIDKARAVLLVVHQTKSKIGVTWGNPDTHIGGDAFNFHGSVTLNLVRFSSIKDGKEIIGHNGIIKTTKNKLFPPFKEVKFELINGKGFTRAFGILEFLRIKKVLVKRGAWYHFKEDKDLRFNGKDAFPEFMRTNKKGRVLIKHALKNL